MKPWASAQRLIWPQFARSLADFADLAKHYPLQMVVIKTAAFLGCGYQARAGWIPLEKVE